MTKKTTGERLSNSEQIKLRSMAKNSVQKKIFDIKQANLNRLQSLRTRRK